MLVCYTCVAFNRFGSRQWGHIWPNEVKAANTNINDGIFDFKFKDKVLMLSSLITLNNGTIGTPENSCKGQTKVLCLDAACGNLF